MSHVDVGDHYFACRCSKESKGECNWIMREAKRILGHGQSNGRGGTYKVTPSNLLTQAVYWLNWQHNAMLTAMPNDQWSAVCSERQAWNPDTRKFEEKKSDQTYIQCDRLEDGVAATVVYYYQKYGDEST